jgi:DNA-3-methyladenine glycosylase II
MEHAQAIRKKLNGTASSAARDAARMSLDTRPAASLSRHEIRVAVPYRLDLTVSALRRLSTNVVDVLTPDGQYVRALGGSREAVIARVTQVHPEALAVTLEGDEREHRRALALVRRMLGVDRDLSHFDRAAAGIPWLKPLAERWRGLKPPRYPTLWEACVNAIVFQQVSLLAASAIMRRLIVALGRSLDSEGVPLYAFPTVESVQDADHQLMRAAGLSLGKLTTLRRVSEAFTAGTLDEAMLENRSSPDAAALLCEIKGIGPWTAAVILLRGLGRLDVFPMNDTSVARNLALVSGSAPIDVGGTLHALSPQEGMLYYHLLLARLDARDDLGRASVPAGANHDAPFIQSRGLRGLRSDDREME